LDPTHQGDSWEGIPAIGPVTVNTEQPPAAAALVRMHFRRVNSTSSEGLDLSSETGGLVIMNAETWEFMVPEIPYGEFTLTQGEWEADLEVTNVAGFRKTYAVFVLPVRREITK
jgi:hypothetical protein